MVRLISVGVLIISFVAHAISETDFVEDAAQGAAQGAAQTAAQTATQTAAHAAHHGASTAAQAIAASQQAAMMYRLLFAKGVMDYFQRKEMEKANQVLAGKMEKLQRDLQAGKLTSAQYAAIKAAVEDTYAKYSKIEAAKDKEIQSSQNGGEKISKLNSLDLSGGSSATHKEERQKSELQSSDLAQLDSSPRDLKTQSNQNSEKTESSKPSMDSSTTGVLIPGQGFTSNSAGQTVPSQTLVIQNSLGTDTETKAQPTNSSASRGLANFEGGLSGFERFSGSFEGEQEPREFSGNSFEQDTDDFRQNSPGSEQRNTIAGIGSSFHNLLKPIKFQRNPFSTKIQTEEGIHLGVLFLVLGFAFVLGRKFRSPKKLPKVIPEVVLSPEREVRSCSKSLTVQTPVSNRTRMQRN